jgi:hypothetical protein
MYTKLWLQGFLKNDHLEDSKGKLQDNINLDLRELGYEDGISSGLCAVLELLNVEG